VIIPETDPPNKPNKAPEAPTPISSFSRKREESKLPPNPEMRYPQPNAESSKFSPQLHTDEDQG
jgi:hypothetical protein